MNKLIGNTPLIKIKYKYNQKIKDVYIKLEYYNLTGSIKDRMAYYIIKKAYEKKLLKEGQPIIEATSDTKLVMHLDTAPWILLED